jgi:hypothetical protein
MKYYLIDTLPACIDGVRIQAWNPQTRKLESAPQYLTHLTLGLDDDGEVVDITEISESEFKSRIAKFK